MCTYSRCLSSYKLWNFVRIKLHPKKNVTQNQTSPYKTLTFIKLRFQMQNILPLASETTISHSITHRAYIETRDSAGRGLSKVWLDLPGLKCVFSPSFRHHFRHHFQFHLIFQTIFNIIVIIFVVVRKWRQKTVTSVKMSEKASNSWMLLKKFNLR